MKHTETIIGKTLVKIIMGDITEQETEAIVNAANSGLLGGGGVDGAIHRAGGPQILAECKEIRARQGTLPTGRAVITSGGRLKARYVIHTVGPVWSGGNSNEDELLRSAYRSSLALASERGIRSISFPSISTGIYSFPVDRAARLALREVRDFVKIQPGFEEVRFVLFSAPVLKEFETAWEEIGSQFSEEVVKPVDDM
jgi:O-acetyl-ADP-ribose deacetylase